MKQSVEMAFEELNRRREESQLARHLEAQASQEQAWLAPYKQPEKELAAHQVMSWDTEELESLPGQEPKEPRKEPHSY